MLDDEYSENYAVRDMSDKVSNAPSHEDIVTNFIQNQEKNKNKISPFNPREEANHFETLDKDKLFRAESETPNQIMGNKGGLNDPEDITESAQR